jgi:hypothetical protein
MKYTFDHDDCEVTYDSETGEITSGYVTLNIYDYSLVKTKGCVHYDTWECYIFRNPDDEDYPNKMVSPDMMMFFKKLFNLVYGTNCGNAYPWLDKLVVLRRPTITMSLGIITLDRDKNDPPCISITDDDLSKLSMILPLYEGRYLYDCSGDKSF